MTTPWKFGLSQETFHAVRSVLVKYPGIEKVVLYGSRAKGNFRPGSDIDLTLVAPSLGVDDLLRIQGEMENLPIPYKVDLSLFHVLDNPDLIDHIQRIGIEFK